MLNSFHGLKNAGLMIMLLVWSKRIQVCLARLTREAPLPPPPREGEKGGNTKKFNCSFLLFQQRTKTKNWIRMMTRRGCWTSCSANMTLNFAPCLRKETLCAWSLVSRSIKLLKWWVLLTLEISNRLFSLLVRVNTCKSNEKSAQRQFSNRLYNNVLTSESADEILRSGHLGWLSDEILSK